MFVSVIVPTYKDTQALEMILDGLQLQTYKNFEVVVAEDNNSDDVEKLLSGYTSWYKIKHFSQEDDGYQKPKALNGAISMASGEYLIFFDGDCLPYSDFIKAHVHNADFDRVLCGRRINLGDVFSNNLRQRNLFVQDIENNFFKYYRAIKKEGARHLECGMKIIPTLGLQHLLKSRTALIGCNFSLHKKQLLKINGFDEDFPKNTTLADDVDVEWRLEKIGMHVASVKYTAMLLHLNHPRANRVSNNIENMKRMKDNQKANKYFCNHGIIKG